MARAAPRGGVIFGYFFAPDMMSSSVESFKGRRLKDAVLRLRFGDLGLINGDWPVLGKIDDWRREEWPMPDFVRREPGVSFFYRVRFSDRDPNEYEHDERVDIADDLESIAIYGYGAVEKEIMKLLN